MSTECNVAFYLGHFGKKGKGNGVVHYILCCKTRKVILCFSCPESPLGSCISRKYHAKIIVLYSM